jgi:hypothetical protein
MLLAAFVSQHRLGSAPQCKNLLVGRDIDCLNLYGDKNWHL